MLIPSLVWQTLSTRLIASWGAKPGHTNKVSLAVPYGPSLANDYKGQTSAITFYNRAPSRCHRRVRSGRFTGTTPSGSLAPDHKTSFSRSNPMTRGQATSTRSSTRRSQSPEQQKTLKAWSALSCDPSGSIFSSQCLQNRHRPKPMQTFYFFKG